MDDGARPVGALLVTGPLGSGKTSVAVELGLQLDDHGVANAVVDLDWLCWVGPGISGDRLRALMHDNLRSLVARCRAEGVERFVLARAMQSSADVDAVRDAIAPGTLVVVRLEVSAAVAAARVRARGGDGAVVHEDLAEQTELWAASTVLPADVVVVNEGRPVPDVAAEVLRTVAGDPLGQWAMPSAL
jgi:adenylylsulfate kinase